MPTIPAEASRNTYEMRGLSITLPNVYSSGMALDDVAAKFLNTAIASRVLNSFSSALRREMEAIDVSRAKAFKNKEYDGPLTDKGKPAPATLEDLDTSNIQAELDEAFAEYDLAGNRSGGGTRVSALDAEIKRLATAKVIEGLKKKGRKINEVRKAVDADGEKVFDKIVAQYTERFHDDLKAAAEEIIATRSAVGDDTTEADDLFDA